MMQINKKSVFEMAKNLCIRLFVIDEENLSDQDEENFAKSSLLLIGTT